MVFLMGKRDINFESYAIETVKVYLFRPIVKKNVPEMDKQKKIRNRFTASIKKSLTYILFTSLERCPFPFSQ